MTVEYIDGIKIMRLHDCNGQAGTFGADMAMLRFWQILTGGHAMRDASVSDRTL